MGLTYTVEFDDAAVTGALDRLAALGVAPEGLLTILGDYGRDSTRRRWLTQSAPDGTPWAGLSAGYALLKPANKGILYLSGALENSQTYLVGINAVSWGSRMPYAAVHQFGATIKPKTAKALVFRLGVGGMHEVFAQSVTIPARPYLGISAEDALEIPELARDYMQRVLLGG
jgi:phage gpG-like protein